jgi:subtilase family serine protease
VKRRATILAISAAAVAATLPALPAVNAEPPSFAQAERRVCAAPSAGVVQCHAHVVTHGATGEPMATTSYQSGFTPAQLQTAYGPRGNNAPLVAVVDAYAHPAAATDLEVYRQRFSLGTATLTQMNQSGGSITTVSPNIGWGQEEMLDLEMVSALCPACPILYVGANSNQFTDMAAAVNRAKLAGAKVISNSYGGNEFSSETSATYSNPYNVSGVAVTVSSGDNGYGVEFPAAAKNVIAVGGTHLTLNSDGTRATETVWSGAGSGCSAYVGKPSWQDQTGCSRRMVADIAAVADPATGVAVFDSYGSTGGASWYVFGGTSVAAPLVGAIYATYGVPLGASGYPVQNAWVHRTDLFDVNSGTNGRCTKGGRNSAPAYFCTGVAGYDGPTGNGTPKGLSSPF